MSDFTKKEKKITRIKKRFSLGHLQQLLSCRLIKAKFVAAVGSHLLVSPGLSRPNIACELEQRSVERFSL